MVLKQPIQRALYENHNQVILIKTNCVDNNFGSQDNDPDNVERLKSVMLLKIKITF